MGRRSRQAKQDAALGYAVGIDDLTSSLDFRKRWSDFTEEVKEANKDAAKKSAFTSFVRTAVFYATAVATGGMSLAASAAISYTSSALSGLAADELLYGDLDVPKAPKKKATKFNKARNIEKHQQLETAYGELESDIGLAESQIDTAHYVEPLTHVVAFYGPKMIDAKWGGMGPTGGQPVSMLDSAGQKAAQQGIINSGGIPDIGTGSLASAGATGPGATSAGTPTVASSGPSGTSAGATTSSQGGDIDWAAIEDTLRDIAPDVTMTENNAPQGAEIKDVNNPAAYDSPVDYYDFLDESADIV